MSGENGFIVHPTYPKPYQDNLDCTYVISVVPGKVVRISFDKIDLERSTQCSYDYVEIKDTFNTRERMRVCKPGTVYTSGGRSLVLRFYTDESGTRNGFKLKWQAVTKDSTKDSTTTPVPIATTTTKSTTTKPTTSTTTTPVTTTPVTTTPKRMYFFLHSLTKCYEMMLGIFSKVT